MTAALLSEPTRTSGSPPRGLNVALDHGEQLAGPAQAEASAARPTAPLPPDMMAGCGA